MAENTLKFLQCYVRPFFNIRHERVITKVNDFVFQASPVQATTNKKPRLNWFLHGILRDGNGRMKEKNEKKVKKNEHLQKDFILCIFDNIVKSYFENVYDNHFSKMLHRLLLKTFMKFQYNFCTPPIGNFEKGQLKISVSVHNKAKLVLSQILIMLQF